MHYTVIVLSLERFKIVFDRAYPEISRQLNIRFGDEYLLEKEHAYDWVVTNAILNYLQNRTTARVYNHYKHDLYRCIYDSFEPDLYLDFSRQFENAKVKFNNNELIKVMVTGNSLFIAKGYTDG